MGDETGMVEEIVTTLSPLWSVVTGAGEEVARQVGERVFGKLKGAAADKAEQLLTQVREKIASRWSDTTPPTTLTAETLAIASPSDQDRQWLAEVHALTRELLPLMKGVKVKENRGGVVSATVGKVEIHNHSPKKKVKSRP